MGVILGAAATGWGLPTPPPLSSLATLIKHDVNRSFSSELQ